MVADDICSQTWLGFFRQWDKNRIAVKPVGVLVTIADRRITDWLTRRSRVETCASGELIDLREQNPLTQHMRHDLESDVAIDLARALVDLRSDLRMVILLHCVAELPVVDVARHMWRNRSRIYQLLKEARQALQTMPKLAAYRRRAENPVHVVLRVRALLVGPSHAADAIMRIVMDLVAEHRGVAAPDWPELPDGINSLHLAKARDCLAGLEIGQWNLTDLASVYEHLSDCPDSMPPALVEEVARAALDPLLAEASTASEPDSVLQITVCDIACRSGVFLMASARYIAAIYAQRRYGEASAVTMERVMPEVISRTIYGIDPDAIAVEVCRASLWFQLGSRSPAQWIERHIFRSDSLSSLVNTRFGGRFRG